MSPLQQDATGLAPIPTADILRRFFHDGQNTCEIGQALNLPEAQVVEVVRVERERRVAVYAGRQER